MGKKFSSIEEVARYIKTVCHNEILLDISDESIKIMQEVTQKQVTGNTGDILRCIDITKLDNNSVAIAWQDTGGWYSISRKTYGQHMYVPYSLENGLVWNISGGSRPGNPIYKPATTLELTSSKLIEPKAKKIYKDVMRRKGFKVK